MTTHVTIADNQIDQDSPITQGLMTALRDNLRATMEGASTSPVLGAAWHPYDMVDVGDGADGVIYDFAVDGTVSEVITPDFADNFEYRFWFNGLSMSTGSSINLNFSPYLQTGAGYDTEAAIWVQTVVSAVSRGYLELLAPRLSYPIHFARYALRETTTDGTVAPAQYAWDHTAQKLLRGRFRFQSGSIDGGVIRMEKRLCFA